MQAEFWRDRRVLVTGHTGFKGSWLCLWLQRLGASIIGFALEPPTQPALYELARVGDGMTTVFGDVLDPGHLRRVMADHRPEVVFHLAAQPLVHESYREPLKTFETNVLGTANVLDGVRLSETVRAVVCITSDKCYENKEWPWGYREDDVLGGHDPYSGSKGCAELVAKAYRDSFLNPAVAGREVFLATARAGNVIGGGDWSTDRLVPDTIRALSAQQPVVLRNPHAIRPWQHVLDPLNGYLTLAERLATTGDRFAEAWNFGPYPANAQSVQVVAERLCSLWPSAAVWQQDEREQPSEDIHLMLDSSKARVRLGWRALLDLDEALGWVVEWHREVQDGHEPRELCERQIDRFDEIAAVAAADAVQTRSGSPSSARLHVLDLAPDPVIGRRMDGTITYWNAPAKYLYGWETDEALGNNSHALLRTQFDLPLSEIERELRENGRWRGTLVHTTRAGDRVNVSSYWAVQDDAENSRLVLEFNRVA